MSLSSCEKCWDTPCECGWEYRNWTKERREKFASAVLGVKIEELRNAICAPEKYPMMNANIQNREAVSE